MRDRGAVLRDVSWIEPELAPSARALAYTLIAAAVAVAIAIAWVVAR